MMMIWARCPVEEEDAGWRHAWWDSSAGRQVGGRSFNGSANDPNFTLSPTTFEDVAGVDEAVRGLNRRHFEKSGAVL